MQKKIFAILIVAVVALFTGYNIYQGQSAEATLSDLALTNVEALAKGGDKPGTHNHGPTRNPFLGKKYCKNENQVDCAY
ncbi:MULTISPECIES: NVEALA domain-containing protein [Bacteroides]|uniref:NVEALA domain-containing protein n=1 Tax=Bacteroides fragilis TaxID=817 RepID=A0ABD4VUN2_BACFG|nr:MULTISPECIES: NVEALA domain-containing protein [Bacteroides]MCZ2655075.1 NVEALA domain-containing protein [Bacteroides fragilis]MDV6193484.1 NVEALA domain-containing protein [Bacteroides hominis (ex Liu et al. 2022)]